MYTAPDFVKVELMVKNAFANTSSCVYDEGTNYTINTGNLDVCDGSLGTYINRIPHKTYLCYSTRNE